MAYNGDWELANQMVMEPLGVGVGVMDKQIEGRVDGGNMWHQWSTDHHEDHHKDQSACGINS